MGVVVCRAAWLARCPVARILPAKGECCAQDDSRAGGYCVAVGKFVQRSRLACRVLRHAGCMADFRLRKKIPLNIERSRIQDSGATEDLTAQSGKCSHHSHFF